MLLHQETSNKQTSHNEKVTESFQSLYIPVYLKYCIRHSLSSPVQFNKHYFGPELKGSFLEVFTFSY